MTKQMAITTKFLLKKYKNLAPPLSRLTTKEATYLLKYDTYQEDKVKMKIDELKKEKGYSEETEAINIAKIISNKIENNSIKDWICMKVLKKYKKNSEERQSLWNTDKSRLHFVIKELIKNEIEDVKEVKEVKKIKVVKKVTKKVAKKVAAYEDKEDEDVYDVHDETLVGFWKEDPQGAKVVELIIRPILDVVEKLLLDGMKILGSKAIKDTITTCEMIVYGEISTSHKDFKQTLVDQTFEKKILSKIASELYLNKKPTLEA